MAEIIIDGENVPVNWEGSKDGTNWVPLTQEQAAALVVANPAPTNADAFRERSQVERALLARGLHGSMIVIATNGPWLNSDIENGPGDCVEDLGLIGPKECQEPGLYLWEGTGKIYYSGPDYEPDSSYTGTVRPVTMEELPALLAMEPPSIICHECSQANGIETSHAPPQCPEDRETAAPGDAHYRPKTE
jgi:hypothetical protein